MAPGTDQLSPKSHLQDPESWTGQWSLLSTSGPRQEGREGWKGMSGWSRTDPTAADWQQCPEAWIWGNHWRLLKLCCFSRGIILRSQSPFCWRQNWCPHSTHQRVLVVNCCVAASTRGIWFSSYSLTSPTKNSASNRHRGYGGREHSVPFQRRSDTFLFANAFHFQHIYCCNIWTKKMFGNQWSNLVKLWCLEGIARVLHTVWLYILFTSQVHRFDEEMKMGLLIGKQENERAAVQIG